MSNLICFVCFVSFLILSPVSPAFGVVFLTKDEVLRLAFPDSRIERRTVYLTRAQLAQARELAGVDIRSAIVYPYVAVRDSGIVGVAYFDAHIVRTQPETVMIVVNHEDRVQRIEMLSFHEPPEYIPRDAWYAQFLGQRLDDELRLKRHIPNIVGATLTARAITEAVRRVLAIHRVLKEQLVP